MTKKLHLRVLTALSLGLISFSGLAQTTSITDSVFEQALINLGYDDVIDGSVATASINTITELDIEGLGITSLAGIEDFTALEELHASENLLTSIDVSNNTALTVLEVNDNALTSLDVTANTALTELYSEDNTFSTIDLSANTALTLFASASCGIASMDLSNNTDLEILDLADNALTELDLSANTALFLIELTENALESLNVANGNNEIITEFYIEENPSLECVQVDDVDFSEANWEDKDDQTSYSLECNGTLGVEDIMFSNNVSVYPNPFENEIHIVNGNSVEILGLHIMNVAGSTLLVTNQNTIDVSALSTGVYFLKVDTNKGTITKKIIKK